MKLNKLITTKGLLFLLIFSILVFIGDRINFSRLVGAESQFFTLFQFFGPVAGAFLGPVVGVLSVLIAEISSKVVQGNFNVLVDGFLAFFNTGDFRFLLDVDILRLLPMLFAAWYFGTKKDKLSYLIPVLAIIAFIAHPVGRQVWYFSLFWTIPFILKIVPEKYSRYSVAGIIAVMGIIMFWLNPSLRTIAPIAGFAVILALSFRFSDISSKSLGATFTAHAVGGAMWNYIVPMTPAMWIALIPIVIFERIVFASGISISFAALNTLLDKLDVKTKAEYINVDKRYVLFKHGT